MNYGLIYTIPFASLRNEACVVEIEKENYTGVATELIGAESPFDVDVDDNDFLYIPSRFSTARIRVVGSDYLQQLYSTAYQQYRVTFKRNEVAIWHGFVKPEIYTQDYSSDKFELEIECQSAMSVLEYINYKQAGVDGRVFVSLWDLIKKCVESSRGQYAAVYIPHVYARDKREYDLGDNILEYMTISEQNFFDEDDKAMKLKEVLEEICKFLNWTCVDYLGSLYFIDSDHAGDYHCYDRLPNWNTFLTVSPKAVINVQRIGFAGADHALDFLPGYNKCTVKTSNYCMPVMSVNEDYDELDTAIIMPDFTEGNRVTRKVILLPSSVDMRQYNVDSGGKIMALTKEYVKANKQNANLILGALPIRFCEYEMVDKDGVWKPNITEYDYTDAVQIRLKPDSYSEQNEFNLGIRPLIVIKGESSVYNHGAFCISCQWAILTRNDLGVMLNELRYDSPELICSLRVGDRWWNGKYFVQSAQPITFEISPSNSRSEAIKWMSVKNTKELNMPYDGMNGYLIDFGNDLVGEFEFSMYAPFFNRLTSPEVYSYPYGMLVKDLKVEYKPLDSLLQKDKNSDRYYENIVNEDYINELDEIEFKISSYNNDGACYSKVLLDDNYLTNNLYSVLVDKAIRPEEHLIQRIVNRYDATRIKLTQVIKETPELTPLTKLSDNFMVGKIFMPVGGSIDYKMGQYKCVMVEV